jgi:hypothetical protein
MDSSFMHRKITGTPAKVRSDINLMVKDYGLNDKVQRRRAKRRPLEPIVS